MKNIIVVYTLVALVCACHMVCADWTIDTSKKENGKYAALDAAHKLKIEVVTVQSDPVFDTAKDEALKKMDTSHSTTAYNEKSQLYPTSLAVRLSHEDKVIYSLAEGKAPPHDFLKLSKDGVVDTAILATIKTAMAKLTVHDDERVNKRLKSIPDIMELALEHHQAKHSTEGSPLTANTAPKAHTSPGRHEHPIAVAARFRQKSSQSRFLQTKSQVGVHNVRFDVEVYTARAFYITPGEHSCTNIVKINVNDNTSVGITTMCNHGRCPDKCAYKCTHQGAVVSSAEATDPETWACTTPYWAWNCIRGPNHNCNAATTHQIQCSDSPSHLPAHDAGICATDCPMSSPGC